MFTLSLTSKIFIRGTVNVATQFHTPTRAIFELLPYQHPQNVTLYIQNSYHVPSYFHIIEKENKD
jgi:hypothetical protein